MSPSTLVVIVSLSLLQGVVGQGDDCSLKAVGLRSTRGAVVTVPSGCVRGTVDWHYPRGDLTLNFSGLTSGQRVCVQPSFIQGPTTATVGNRTITLTFTNTGVMADLMTSCVWSNTTAVSVKFNAPSLVYYLNPIDYAILN